MKQPLNIQAFTGSKRNSFLEAAKGVSRLGSDWPEYNGGIPNPKRGHLSVGQKYFHFASSKASLEQSQLSGSWWIDYETFRKITDFINGNSLTIREAVRYYLALPKDWTDVDVLVSAILEAPMDCYAGEGRKATGAHPMDYGSSYIPPQHIKIKQLYIPMLEIFRKEVFPDPIIRRIWKSI